MDMASLRGAALVALGQAGDVAHRLVEVAVDHDLAVGFPAAGIQGHVDVEPLVEEHLHPKGGS